MASPQPYNQSTKENPVGRFMVASGAVIEQANTGKILLIQRSASLDWHPNQWEVVYGRIDQFEDTEIGLQREVREEAGITDLQIISLLRVWHIFRGTEKLAENEVIGITYHCRTEQPEPTLSSEHQAYAWVHPEEALEMVQEDGIRRDIEKFIEKSKVVS